MEAVNIFYFLFFMLSFLTSLLFVGVLYYFDIMSVKKANEAISAKQASHNRPTSRVGGLAAITALLIGVCFVADKLVVCIVFSSIPIFIAGFLEDLGYRIRPIYRFNAGFLSAVIAIFLTGLWLDDVDITILTPFLAFPFIAIPFTAFASTGVVNSINLIDGVNGLASGIITVIGSALCIISLSVGEVGLAIFCIILVGSIFGFFIWNYPRGLIFLGDAGAYTYGHFLVWVAISLASKYPAISSWAIFCIFFWPIMDTVAAILRRYLKRSSINQADYMHFHQLVMRAMIIYSNGRIPKKLANPVSTIIILPFCILISVLGVLFLESNYRSLLTVICATFLFFFSYYLLFLIARSKAFRKFIKN